MNKLFKQISQSYYGQWLLYGTGGLVSVAMFPSFSLGWICLNIIIFYFINIISIIFHELGHAIAALCLGMEVNKIVIGSGENILEFQILGIPWKIKQVPFGGAAYILCKSTYLYRSRSFIVSLFGPLTNLMLVLLTLKFPKEFITFNPPDVYIFPGIILCVGNTIFVIKSLLPQYVDFDGSRVPNDGLRMWTLPSLSTKKVSEEVAGYWLFDGYNLALNDNYQKAIKSFGQALHHKPDYFDAYQRRGNVCRSIKDDRQAVGNYQQAINILDQKAELEHLNPAHYYSRGLVYIDWMIIDANQSPKAITALTQAIDLDPRNKSFYCARASVYCCSGFETQAVKDFTRIIEIQPDGDAYYNRGAIHCQCKNYHAAIEDLDLAIKLDSNSVSAYYNRGNAKYELEDKSGAFQDYDRAKFLSSTGAVIDEDEYGFYARGIAHIRLKNEANAIKDFQKAETLCLEHGNTSLLKQIRSEIEKIST